MNKYSEIYEVEKDPIRNRVLVHIRGYFDAESHAQFREDVIAAVKVMSSAGQKPTAIFDTRGGKVQNKETAQNNDWVLEILPLISKAAIIVESVLYKMQLQRKPLDESVKFFNSVEEAESWFAE